MISEFSVRNLTRAFVWFLGALVLLAPNLSATSFTLDAKSNIFGAGQASVPVLGPDQPTDPRITMDPAYPGSGPGILPLERPIVPVHPGTPDPYLYLYFPGMTGQVQFNGDAATAHGPDGIRWHDVTDLSTNISSVGSISGIMRNQSVLFIVGVFLGPSLPASAPARLDSNCMPIAGGPCGDAQNVVDFRPQLGQTFFVGDGLTAGGARQRFFVPSGATRFYLGFEDGWNFTGASSWYDDNVGAFTVNYDYASAAPEPSTFVLLGGGLLLAGVLLRKKRVRR